jgi:hypothetical protein
MVPITNESYICFIESGFNYHFQWNLITYIFHICAKLQNFTQRKCLFWCPPIHVRMGGLFLSGTSNYHLLVIASACVDFGCTHPIDELFWNLLPIYLLGFFSKSECWVTDLIMLLYHFVFFGLSLAFLYHEVSYHYEIYIKNSYD